MSTNNSVELEDYGVLKQQFLQLKIELDQTKQDLHVSRKNFQVLEATHSDVQAEVEELHSKESVRKRIYEEKIAHIEEQRNSAKIKYEENLQHFRVKLMEQEKINDVLKTELECLKKNEVSTVKNDSVNKYIDEIANLKRENEEHASIQEEMGCQLDKLKKCNTSLEEQLLNYKNEFEQLKETVSYKQTELSEQKDLVQKLNEEIICLKNELDTCKSKPLDSLNKGNSLFAEVDDRRVHLQSTIDSMNAKFVSMENEIFTYKDKIHQLELENDRRLHEWEADLAEVEEDKYNVEKSYKHQIKTLEDLIQQFKKDLETKSFVISNENEQIMQVAYFYDNLIKYKRDEVEELRGQLSTRTASILSLSKCLKESNDEKRKWKLKALSLE